MTEMRSLPPAAFLGPLPIPMASEVCAHIYAPHTPASVPLSLQPHVLLSHHLLQETDLRRGSPSLLLCAQVLALGPNTQVLSKGFLNESKASFYLH